MSAVLTMVMFGGGLTSSVLSILTFQNIELRQVGCGMYLLVSSITSLLIISMLTLDFWFIVLTRMSVSVRLPVFRSVCVSIEPLLKVFLYVDTWLNACVAVERAVSVSQGVGFDKMKSKRIAYWIIVILSLSETETESNCRIIRFDSIRLSRTEPNRIQILKKWVESNRTEYTMSRTEPNRIKIFLFVSVSDVYNTQELTRPSNDS